MKKFLLALLATVSVFCLMLGFAACGEETINEGQNTEQSGNNQNSETDAPVYLGMSIQNSAPQTIMPATAFPALWAQGDEVYQSRTNTDILITIHFENPEQYEIMSFTLNEKKYAVNMFESGSDLENIILKVAVGDFDEVTEYTIDAIKYIDGEAIKDVKIGGEQTVKLYREYDITYHDTFEAEYPTEYTVLSDTISFDELSRTGYTFEGWFEDEAYTKKIESIEKGSKGDRDIYAKWEIVTYNIEYVLDGGENPEENPKTYTVEDKIELFHAKKDENVFLGWYKDEAHKELVQTLENATGDLKLYAFWTEGTEGLEFKEAEGGYAVTGYHGESAEVVIPDKCFGGGLVTEIESIAFDGCSSLESVTIGKGIIAIKESAFADCTGLKKVEIHDISSWLNIEFSDNPLFYAHHLFLNGVEIVELNIPEGATKIASKAFLECEGIKKVIMPRGVLNIGDSAFEGCSALENVTIADTVTTIEIQAFCNCYALKSLKLPDGIMEIGECAFEGSALEEIVIPTGVSEIKDNTFMWCKNLKKVTIPNRVIKIGNTAFCYCYALESIVIPDSVTTICGGAFEYTGLKSIILGKGITKIEDFIFGLCDQLTEISYNGSKEEWEKIELDSRWNEGSKIGKIICKDGNQEIEVVNDSI